MDIRKGRQGLQGWKSAAGGCLAGEFELARPELQKAVKVGKTSREEHYKKARRRPLLGPLSFRERGSEKFSRKYAEFAYNMFTAYARRARALAERFGIQID